MHISDKGLDIIKQFEGYERKLPDGSCTAYRDYLGNGKYDIPTIGWGCTEDVHMGDIWTRQQAEDGLRREVSKFESAVSKLIKFVPNQNQFDALVSFTYNVGAGNLERSSVLRLANKGNFEGAARAFLLYNRAQGEPQSGLTRRRHMEAALFLSPVDNNVIAATTPDEVSPEVNGSRKDTLNDAHIVVAGGTALASITTMSGVLPQIQIIIDFFKNNSAEILLTVSLLGLIGFLAMKFWMRQDKAEGRYFEHG